MIVEGVEKFADGIQQVIVWISLGFRTFGEGVAIVVLIIVALPFIYLVLLVHQSGTSTFYSSKHPPSGTIVDSWSDRYIVADGQGGTHTVLREDD